MSNLNVVFKNNFNKLLDNKGVPPLHYGRHKWVGKRYNVTPTAARKWIVGICLPETPRLVEICDDLDCSVDELLRPQLKN